MHGLLVNFSYEYSLSKVTAEELLESGFEIKTLTLKISRKEIAFLKMHLNIVFPENVFVAGISGTFIIRDDLWGEWKICKKVVYNQSRG